jgi:apolipoprotein N-acyltransferase
MHTSILSKNALWYSAKNRWWLPLLLGCFYALSFAPFNAETHPALALFPLLGFVALVPLCAFAVVDPLRRAIGHLYLFGITASFFQFYWIANDVAEGLWHMILIGLMLITLFIALYFLCAGLLFRLIYRRFPRLAVVIYPSVWILLEYVRGLGDIGFPWNYLGYGIAQLPGLGQAVSLSGVFGLSFAAVMGNLLVWRLLRDASQGRSLRRGWIGAGFFAAAVVIGLGWGSLRLHQHPVRTGDGVSVSLIQNNIDQAHWGDGSLDTALTITGAMVHEAAQLKPDLMVMPESALFCYLMRRQQVKNLVTQWSDSVRVPMILGSLHWDRVADPQKKFRYAVYNAAFMVDTVGKRFTPYYKMTLVPFSEVMPFKNFLPLLNRLNLGGADFTAGRDRVVFNPGAGIHAVPLICYEAIFPGQVRNRMLEGANLIVNITNDGWFGRSTASAQHAFMTRMRCIENGISMARCANSGISILVDQYGRVSKKTRLYTRTVATGTVSLQRVPTFYSRVGDWPLLFAAVVTILAGIGLLLRLARRKPRGQTDRPVELILPKTDAETTKTTSESLRSQ